VRRRTGANRCPAQRTRSGTDRRTSATADRRTQASAQKGADDRGADLPVVGGLRTIADLTGRKLLAQCLVALKRFKRFSRCRHHANSRPLWFRCARTQQREGQQDGGGTSQQAQWCFPYLKGVAGTSCQGV
jgi:hypothetical protein